MVWRFSRLYAKGRTQQSETFIGANDSISNTANVCDIPVTHAEQANDAYALPENIQQLQRDAVLHYLLRTLLKGNYRIPIQAPQHILDIGCGSGIWCRDLAHQFPQAHIYGIDLTNSRPVSSANVHFIAGQTPQELPFQENSFDFIHQRFLAYSLQPRQWPGLLNHMHRVARHGAWIEFVEGASEYCTPSGPANTQLADGLSQLAGQRGLDIDLINRLDTLINPALFVNMKKEQFSLPLGNWAGLMGTLMARECLTYIADQKNAFLEDLGYTARQFDSIAQTVTAEWETLHSTITINVIYAQVKKESRY